MEIILRTLLWAIPIGLIVYLIYVFTTPETTQYCSEALVVCMDKANDMIWYEKYYMGTWCVLKNVGCVLTAIF